MQHLIDIKDIVNNMMLLHHLRKDFHIHNGDVS